MKKEKVLFCLFVIILLKSIHAYAQECLFIAAADTLKDTEKNVSQKLEDWGYNISVVIVDNLVNYTEADYAGFDFTFASESINSSKLAPLKLMPIPLVNTEAWASKPAALAWSDPASAVNIAPEPVMIVDNTGNPLAAGYKDGDIVDLVADPAGLMITTVPTIDVIPIGVLDSDPSKSIIYGIEKGTTLTDGSITENRAVCIGIHEFGYSSMTDAGFEFIHAAINWVTEGSPDAIEEITKTPVEFDLAQNYPNPFNPMTKIQFSILKRAHTDVTVYDAMGKIIEILVDKELDAGKYNFTFSAAGLPSGVYFYKIQSGGIDQVRKMILMK